MTRQTSARIAGVTFILYIVAGVSSLKLFGRASGGGGLAAQLARLPANGAEVQIAVVLALIGSVCAFVLGITLYRITRDEDNELALLALTLRAGEGVLGALPITMLGLMWLAAASAGGTINPSVVLDLGALVRKAGDWQFATSALLFALGSTVFSALFVRGRIVPGPLAWLGVVSSMVLVITLPLQLGGALRGPVANLFWLPMLVFELGLAY